MKFRSDKSEPSKDYLNVCGVYLHGKISEALGNDIVQILKDDAEPFRLMVNESKGIVGDKSNNAVEGTVKVVRLDTPPKEQPPYERNLDAVD